MIESDKRIIIIAGPNGAGKTTFSREILTGDQAGLPFVNADTIAAALNPANPEAEAFHAGRLLLRQIEELVERGESFAFEITMSGRAFARAIPRWRSLGYRVELFFLSLNSPENAIARVALRVRQGGHNIPEEVIRRRFYGGLQNFHEVYKPLVDSWVLYDNTGPERIRLEDGVNP
ncbi:MAG: zeta toxin family protein [Chloroflexota bacterium]|nr:zeta toxin family protein [Chloroflexota bacterium]